jgi:hypothetical protein
MARRKQWGELSPRSRDQAAQIAADYGISRRSARAMYNRGTFRPFARDPVERVPLDVRSHRGKYLKSMRVIAQTGKGVEAVQVDDLNRAQRSEVARHWNLVHNFLSGDKRAGRKLERYEARMTGGPTPVEFANDLEAIKQFALNNKDEISPESIYPEAA